MAMMFQVAQKLPVELHAKLHELRKLRAEEYLKPVEVENKVSTVS